MTLAATAVALPWLYTVRVPADVLDTVMLFSLAELSLMSVEAEIALGSDIRFSYDAAAKIKAKASLLYI